ncbi:MAG: flagellar hook-basal body complex protein FliE [Alphaproteobacteria bacterium]|nr:flagellar hook-basal body complex protein FliE [Alphaproteobacteria bacterium]
MVMNVADVLSVYKKSGGIIDDAGAAAGAPAGGGGASFADALKNFAGDSVSTLKEGEKAATQAATGKADLASVVTAIDNAEVVLDEIVTIRDKALAAYQTISTSQI